MALISGVANMPDLPAGWTPVNHSDKHSFVDTTISNWDVDYSPSTKKWANARDTKGNMWVWIPRFTYKTIRYEDDPNIDIRFSSGIEDNLTSIGGRTTKKHNAFKFGNNELTGIWIAKYTAYRDNDNGSIPGFKFNKAAWREISVNDVFNKCIDLKNHITSKSDGVDSHMLKNIEWGAAGMLAKAIGNQRPYRNSDSAFRNGWATTYIDETGITSTTGNMLGVFDMVGNAYEYVASYVDSNHLVLTSHAKSLVDAESKYKDVFPIGTDDRFENYEAASGLTDGMMINETSGSGNGETGWANWRGQRAASIFPFDRLPLFTRGGNYLVDQSGLAYFNVSGGNSVSNTGFRACFVILNSSPSLADTTNNNKTFYEQDTLNLTGSVSDADNGNIMSVKYKINNGTTRAMATAISDGSTPISYSKTLKYTNGKLLDGATEVATGLADGQTYAITIWAEDDQGGKSTEVVRNFTVVPNRPPVLSIDPITPQTNKINSETLTLSGNVTDADGNDVIVSLRINENTSKQIYSGVPSTFTTDIKISDLIEGNNIITITAKDTFNFVTTKTVTIKKTRNATKLKQAIARYKINPPSGSAKQVLLWVQKEIGDLVVNGDISMVLVGENESYKSMDKLTAPIDDLIEEDEFSHEELTEKDNITLKLKLSKTDPLSTKSIKQISGVLK